LYFITDFLKLSLGIKNGAIYKIHAQHKQHINDEHDDIDEFVELPLRLVNGFCIPKTENISGIPGILRTPRKAIYY
jgi:hypothetical protein